MRTAAEIFECHKMTMINLPTPAEASRKKCIIELFRDKAIYVRRKLMN